MYGGNQVGVTLLKIAVDTKNLPFHNSFGELHTSNLLNRRLKEPRTHSERYHFILFLRTKSQNRRRIGQAKKSHKDHRII